MKIDRKKGAIKIRAYKESNLKADCTVQLSKTFF